MQLSRRQVRRGKARDYVRIATSGRSAANCWRVPIVIEYSTVRKNAGSSLVEPQRGLQKAQGREQKITKQFIPGSCKAWILSWRKLAGRRTFYSRKRLAIISPQKQKQNQDSNNQNGQTCLPRPNNFHKKIKLTNTMKRRTGTHITASPRSLHRSAPHGALVHRDISTWFAPSGPRSPAPVVTSAARIGRRRRNRHPPSGLRCPVAAAAGHDGDAPLRGQPRPRPFPRW